jgi:hypothetical protein
MSRCNTRMANLPCRIIVMMIAIVVLSRNRWSTVELVIADIVAAVNACAPGSYVIVNIPDE